MALPVTPVRGQVYGFNFVFPPNPDIQVHPGLIFATQPSETSAFAVLVFSISHTHARDNDPHVIIPPDERQRMGLDIWDQWVCCSGYHKRTFPTHLKKIKGLDATFLGTASDAFLEHVVDVFKEHRRTAGKTLISSK